MALAEQDIAFIKQHLGEWLAEVSLGKPPAVYEIELRERMIRVEEELKHQRELMQQGFVMMDKRFEELQHQMDKRFDGVDKRFEAVDKRFEAMDKRFEAMDKRFEEITRRLDRFMVWSFSTTVTVGGLVVAILKLWN
ncbi:MAG: hypothetical protein CL923_03275 [Deltaproteobacteria bacterium]|jgi:chaperonin cofactor prefoldin|nr:hypothetical protein [Deltaproteobacteria bacterium]MDP7318848.1 hypothetical protein [SAR324 cluster bacterium]